MLHVTEASSFNSRWAGSGFSIGRLNDDIFCLRFELTLDKGSNFSEFSFTIGDGTDEGSPYFQSEGHTKEQFNILRNGGFFGIINTDKEEFLRSSNKEYLDADKIVSATNRFQINVKEGVDSNRYVITGTVKQNLFDTETYYLWLYAIRLTGGYGRLSSDAYLKILTIDEGSARPLGLAKIYVPKTTGSTEYEYKDALVYIYTNGAWQLALPYVYTGGTWKNTC